MSIDNSTVNDRDAVLELVGIVYRIEEDLKSDGYIISNRDFSRLTKLTSDLGHSLQSDMMTHFYESKDYHNVIETARHVVSEYINFIKPREKIDVKLPKDASDIEILISELEKEG